MSYIDLIIKYLSGDLNGEDSRTFEEELKSNAELKASLEEHAAAYRLIREQLQHRDQQAFEARLAEAMNSDVSQTLPGKMNRRLWFIPPAIACFLAIVLILFLHHPGNERIFSRYHYPLKDPLVLTYLQGTRGHTESGIIQYREGDYAGALELLSGRIAEEKDNKLIQLFNLLAAMELDRQLEALEYISQGSADPKDHLDQSIRWYSVLALVKSDRGEQALKLLHPLTEQEGPYQADASKLEKVLLK